MSIDPIRVQAPTRAIDPRPARTRGQILDAIERLGARGAEITVAAIVVEARISRSTFYSQFSDPGDVAVQLMREIHVDIEKSDERLRADCGPREATSTAIRTLIRELQRRRYLYASVLGSSASSAKAIHEVGRIMAEGARPAVEETAPASVNTHVAATFVSAGVLSVLIDWLLEEHPRPEQQVEAEILELIPNWLAPAESGEPPA